MKASVQTAAVGLKKQEMEKLTQSGSEELESYEPPRSHNMKKEHKKKKNRVNASEASSLIGGTVINSSRSSLRNAGDVANCDQIDSLQNLAINEDPDGKVEKTSRRTPTFDASSDELSINSSERAEDEVSYNSTESTTDEGEQRSSNEKLDEDDEEQHKVFNFSLPFGGSGGLNMVKTIMTNPFSQDPLDKSPDQRLNRSPGKNITKKEIMEKLKRQDSISTLEESILFKDEKGMDKVRQIAVRESFQIDLLKNTKKGLQRLRGDSECDELRLEKVYDEIEGNIIIMGGYRGSILADAKTHKRLWIPLKAGLNISKVDLLIGPKEEDEIAIQKQVISTGMLTHIGPIDLAKKLIKKIDANPNTDIEQFGYDWRLSLEVSANHLKDKLQKIYNKQNVKKGTLIIAHSMGGLVAHKVLQEHAKLIRGIIYVGCPSQCPNILGPLKFGDEVLFSKNVLSPEVNFFTRSSYYFLPFDGHCFVDKNSGKRYDFDYFDPKVWTELGLSPLVYKKRQEPNPHKERSTTSLTSLNTYVNGSQKIVKTLNPLTLLKSVSSSNNLPELQDKFDDTQFRTSFEDSYDYLGRTLKKSKKFLESLEIDPNKKYPPLAIVYGNQIPTVKGAKVDGLQDIIDGKYFDFIYGAGDGVVHRHWLLPEKKGFPVVAKVASSTGHVSLMNDLDAMAKALLAIFTEEKRRLKDNSQQKIQ